MTGSINISKWADSLNNRKPFYLVIFDEAGRMSFTNSNFYTHFRSIQPSVPLNSFFSLVHENDLDQLRYILTECSLRGNTETTELRLKNGHFQWIKWEISRLVKTEKNAARFMCLGYAVAGEEQLKKAQEILGQNCQTIVGEMNAGMLLQDANGSVIAANQKISEILQISLEDLYTKKNIYPSWKTTNEQGNSLSFEETPFMKAISTRSFQSNVVLHLQTPDGDRRTILCNSQPLFEKNQSVPFSVVSTVQDITKEKAFETAAKERSALFSSFMDHTPYFTWIVDQDEQLVFANQSLLEYFRIDGTVFGKRLDSIIPGPIAGIFHEKHRLVLQCRRQDQSIVKSFMADGKEHIYQVIVFPIHGAAPGMMVGGEALDITESWNARQEEKKVNERLLHISQATSEAIWDWNMQNGQIYCNQALHDLLGKGLYQAADLNWYYQCIHREDKERVEQTIRSTLTKKEQSWEAEYRLQFPGGQVKTMHNRGFIIYESGEAVRMIGSLQDVSEIRKLESKLVKQKLKQQKGIAEAIIQAQEEERARIGHELHDNINQILSSGQLYLSILDKETENFGEIKEKTLEIIKLAIEEIRQLSRAMVMPDLRQDGLIASINELVNDLRAVKLFKIDFIHSNPCDIELISQSKKVTLFRIIQEQTKNIVKYSGARHVEVSLQCSEESVRLSIRDDGKGFDSRTTRRGLGLSNIYERTRLYNGKVQLATSPGKGCTITVTIPFDSKTFRS